jgi:hypothetical protein
MPELGRPAIIAIGFAVVALLTSAIAVIVVVRRDAPIVHESGVIERAVNADDVAKLKGDVVEKADGGATVKDDELRKTLGLEPADVITAINGRVIKREFDVYDAVLGASTMDATIVYVDIVRAKRPLLVRWKLEGNLRSVRRDPSPPSSSNPFTAPHDPLVDTIERVDPLHFTVPRASFVRFLANRDYYARQARILPVTGGGGYRLIAIQTGSAWSALGLFNGDVIQTVNGGDPVNPEDYQDASELKISVLRRGGDEETIVISIR